MGYSDKESIVRVDFFKPSGKWYDTRAVDMDGFYNTDVIHEAVKLALHKAGCADRGFIAVVLKPYHKNSFPVMLKPESY